MDQRVGRGIALLFHYRGTRRGERSAARSGRILLRERPGTHCTEGWVAENLAPPGIFLKSMFITPIRCTFPVRDSLQPSRTSAYIASD